MAVAITDIGGDPPGSGTVAYSVVNTDGGKYFYLSVRGVSPTNGYKFAGRIDYKFSYPGGDVSSDSINVSVFPARIPSGGLFGSDLESLEICAFFEALHGLIYEPGDGRLIYDIATGRPMCYV